MNSILLISYKLNYLDDVQLLNLPLWANFYNYTDLSHTTMTLDQPTLLYDLNPQPG